MSWKDIHIHKRENNEGVCFTTGFDFVLRDKTGPLFKQSRNDQGTESYFVSSCESLKGCRGFVTCLKTRRTEEHTFIPSNNRVKLAIPGHLCQVHALRSQQ